MPELFFSLRWPDDSVTEHYSPSSIICEFLAPGTTYAVADFVPRARNALAAASDRVREKYGYACSRAGATLRDIETDAQKFAEPGATVKILDIRP
jgi:uncharacterized repeat protein (TIGR04042 family)